MEISFSGADGASLTLAQRRPYWLTKLDGTGSVQAEHSTYKSPGEDGARLVSSTLEPRRITVEGMVVAGDAEEAYALRRRLLQTLSPREWLTASFRGESIRCRAESVDLVIRTKEKYPGFVASMLCPGVYWETASDALVELATWLRLLRFPLAVFPGWMIGMRQPSQIIKVSNDGDAPSGCAVTFRATGSGVENPELRVMETGEFIRILARMEQGEEFRVYTHFGGKRAVRVAADGAESNAFPLIDPDMTFFQLPPGDSSLRYDCRDPLRREFLDVTLAYRPQWLGV
jgi:hypothetical protein